MFNNNSHNNSTVKLLIQLDKLPFTDEYKLDVFACKLNKKTRKKVVLEIKDSINQFVAVHFEVVEMDKIKAFIVGSYDQLREIKKKFMLSGWDSLVVNR